MLGQLVSISALLLGSALLLFAGGMHGLILPLRGSVEGFTAVSLGLLGTGYAVGYVSGCLLAPGWWARWGISGPSASCAPLPPLRSCCRRWS